MTLAGSLITLIAASFATLPLTLGYVDPGTGSYLLQVLAGGFLGLLFAVKMYWRKIKTSLARFLGRGAGGGDG